MRIRMLPSAVGGPPHHQFATSWLIDDSVAIDAGSLGYADLADQRRVRHVLLSHVHADHTGTLPVLVENVYTGTEDCVTVWGGEHVLDSLAADVFNGRIFPDFINDGPPGAPFLRLERLVLEETVAIEGLQILPVAMDHTVPTMGFVVTDADATVLVAGDTGPTERVWEVANALPGVDAVFLECSFPRRLAEVAVASKHLTGATFGAEVAKLQHDAAIIAVHIKAPFRDETVAELEALDIERLEIGVPGKEYRFPA